MFSRPMFPSWSSSSFDDPFSMASDPFFGGRDPFFDEWNDLLRQQWADQQRFRERASRVRSRGQGQGQGQPQQQPQQQQIKDSGSTNMDIERKYDTNTNANNRQVATTAGNAPSGTVARPRSFWDLSSFPSWSDLTPQQIKLDWSGTEASAKEYVVSACLPDGMNPNDMTISVDERSRLMTLKCQTKSHEEEKDKDGHVISSRSSSSFTQRSIQLPRDVDLSAISASKNTSTQAGGAQLLLHLPKLANPAPEPGVKRITIQ